MSGLSNLKVKIKNQPHNLAWINDKERSVLKAMGGSGKAGPMGIPAYDEDLDIDWTSEDISGAPAEKSGMPDYSEPEEEFAGSSWPTDLMSKKTAEELGLTIAAPPEAPPSIEDKIEEYAKARTLVGNIAATLHQRTLEGDTSPINPDMTLEEAKKAAATMGEGLISELEKKEQRGTITEREAGWLEDLYTKKEKAEREIGFINDMLKEAKAGKDTVISQPEWDPVMDGPRQAGGPPRSLEGPGAWQTYLDAASKGLQGVAGDIGTAIGGLASAYSMGSPVAIAGALLTGRLESHPITAGLAGVPYESPYGLDKPLGGIFSLGGLLGDGGQKELSDLSKDVGKSTKDTLAEVADFYQISTKDVTKDHIESYHKNIKSDKRAGGGQVYNNFITRNEGGPVEEEEKTKSAMELYLEKLGQPSKYTIPTVSMDTPSMAPPPTSSDPFELAEYRKGLARETMGNYLPFDVGGASGALNTFNEDYYGGASTVSPYNMAQMASLLGLRDPGSYEGIIGMLGGVRNEPPPPPEPEPEPEPPVIPDEPYDDEGGNGDGKHGGGIGRILRRQAGGPAQAMMLADPNYRRYPHPGIGQSPPRGPDGKIISDWTSPWPEPPWPPRPEPPIPEPPVVDPPPPPTYDPVREEEARKRARELQAFKIGELDETPQTTAERLALEKSGGMYKDEHGEIRDASGAVHEDWGFDYTPPPELDKKYDPPNTPDTPPPVDPEDPDEPKTGNGFPLPPDVIDPLPPPFDLDRPVWGPPPWDRRPGPHDPRVGIHYDYIQDHGPLNIPGSPNLGQGLQGLQQSQINYMGSPQFGQGLQGLQQGFGMQSPRPFGTPAFSSGFGGFGQQQGYNR